MKVSKVDFNRLSDPGNKYQLEECLSRGVFGRIYKGRDKQTSKCVAVKIQKLVADTKVYVEKEYTILKDFTDHMNLVDFYGCYRKNDEVWLVLEVRRYHPNVKNLKVLNKSLVVVMRWRANNRRSERIDRKKPSTL